MAGYRYQGTDFAIEDPEEPYYEPGSCGTYGGYRKHVRQKTAKCDPCKAANAAYNRDWYARNKEVA